MRTAFLGLGQRLHNVDQFTAVTLARNAQQCIEWTAALGAHQYERGANRVLQGSALRLGRG